MRPASNGGANGFNKIDWQPVFNAAGASSGRVIVASVAASLETRHSVGPSTSAASQSIATTYGRDASISRIASVVLCAAIREI
jgi:hypothetical protein